MNAFEKLLNFEKQSLQTLAYNMCKWFDFDRVNIEYEPRRNVESGIWINIKIEYRGLRFYIDGQRNDIVHKRLVKWLKEHVEKVSNGQYPPPTV